MYKIDSDEGKRRFLQSIVDTVREPMLVLDTGLRVVSANRAFYSVFEATAGETEGRGLYELGDRDWDIPALRRLLEDILPTNNPFNDFEVVHEFPRIGRKIMLLNARALYRAEDDAHYDLILLAIEDVTERRRTQARARESAEHLRLLVEGAKDYAIFTLDRTGRIMTWNTGAERILGYSGGDVFGRPFEILFTDEERNANTPGREMETAARTGQADDDHWLIRKDGTRFYAEGLLTALWDEHGNLRGYGKVLRDSTETRRAEAERADLRRQVAAGVKSQRSFLRDILNSVTEGKLVLCENAEQLPARLPPFAEPVDLIRRTIRELRQATIAAGAAVGLSVERAQDLETVVGEAAMNAVVHGGLPAVARVHADPAQGIVQVWITDSGSGIAMESLHRATLERGFTTAGTLGQGFSMILRLCDRTYLLTGEHGTTVVLEQYRVQPDGPWWLQAPVSSSNSPR